MNISTRQSGTATIVDVTGDVTLYNSPELRTVLMGLLKEKRLPHVIVNMSNVKYIDSAGVASLVEGLKMSRETKSSFAIYGLNRSPRQVFELTHLVKVFSIYETEDEALGNSSAPAKQDPKKS